MTTVTNCNGSAGRLIALGSQAAVPLSLALTYTNGATSAPLVFGPESVQAELVAYLNEFINSQGTPGQVDIAAIGVVTQVEAAQNVLVQFQNALSDTIYVVPFGDAPGDIRLTFIANRACNGPSNDAITVIQHYLDHRILPTRNRGPALIALGGAVFRGHLIAMSLASSYQELPLVQGTLIFKAWPV